MLWNYQMKLIFSFDQGTFSSHWSHQWAVLQVQAWTEAMCTVLCASEICVLKSKHWWWQHPARIIWHITTTSSWTTWWIIWPQLIIQIDSSNKLVGCAYGCWNGYILDVWRLLGLMLHCHSLIRLAVCWQYSNLALVKPYSNNQVPLFSEDLPTLSGGGYLFARRIPQPYIPTFSNSSISICELKYLSKYKWRLERWNGLVMSRTTLVARPCSAFSFAGALPR